MNLPTTLVHTLRNDPWRVLPFAAVAGAGLAMLKLPPAWQGKAALYLMQAAVVLMLFLASSAATRLAQTAQVLAQRRVPASVWSRSLLNCLAGTCANGAALLAVLALPSRAGLALPLLAAGAALSVAACVGTLLSAVRSGMMLRLSQHAAGGATLAALLAYLLFGNQLLITATAWPAVVLVALALCWPGMALALRRYWQVAPAVPASPVQADPASIPAWIIKVSRRVPLNPVQREKTWKNSCISGLQMGIAVLAAGMREGSALGDAVTVRHLLSLAGFLPAAILMVSMRDLHWRSLLLPGCLERGSLAFRIYKTTLQFAATTLASLCVGVLLCDYLLLGKSMAAILHSLEQWAILAMEVPLLAALAVLLTALPRPYVTLGGSFIAAIGVYVLSVMAKLDNAPIPALHTGPAYGAVMLALAGLVLLIADRIWTPPRLLPYLPARPTGAAFSAAR